MLGLYGTEENPRTSYTSLKEDARLIREGKIVIKDGIAYSGIDLILNSPPKNYCFTVLRSLLTRDVVKK